MKASKALCSTAIGAMMLLGGASAALAAPINLQGYTGPIKIKFSNYESFSGSTITTGATNFGVLAVTSITTLAAWNGHPIGYQVWGPGGANGYLTGVFNGITVANATNTSAVANTGGTFNIYQVSSLFDPTLGTGGYSISGCSIGQLCYDGITNVAGADMVLSFELTPGITTDPLTTLTASFNSATLGTTTNGTATGYANITGGSDAAQFQTQTLTTLLAGVFADLSINDTFCGNGGPYGQCIQGSPIGNWQLLSDDPVRASVVPEPGALSLFGAGLLGIGMLSSWRRKRRNG